MVSLEQICKVTSALCDIQSNYVLYSGKWAVCVKFPPGGTLYSIRRLAVLRDAVRRPQTRTRPQNPRRLLQTKNALTLILELTFEVKL